MEFGYYSSTCFYEDPSDPKFFQNTQTDVLDYGNICVSLTLSNASKSPQGNAIVVAFLYGSTDGSEPNSIKVKDLVYLQSSSQMLPLFEVNPSRMWSRNVFTIRCKLDQIEPKTSVEQEFYEELALPFAHQYQIPLGFLVPLIAEALQNQQVDDISHYVHQALTTYEFLG